MNYVRNAKAVDLKRWAAILCAGAGLFGAATAMADGGSPNSAPEATSLSGPGNVPPLQAPAGTPTAEHAFAGLAETRPAHDAEAQRLTESLGTERVTAVRRVRSDLTGDVYVASGDGRVCLALRRPDRSGGEGCAPNDTSQSRRTPIVLAASQGDDRRILALVTNDAISATVETGDGRSAAPIEKNIADAVVGDAPESLVVEYRDGTKATVDLRDVDPNAH